MKVKLLSNGNYLGIDHHIGKVFEAKKSNIGNGKYVLIAAKDLPYKNGKICKRGPWAFFPSEVEVIKKKKRSLKAKN